MDWARFNIRAYLNNHAAPFAVASVVLLLITLGLIQRSKPDPPPRVLQQYYYDLNTQTIFADRAGRPTPFDRGSGAVEYPDGVFGSAVGARIYTCGDPDDVRPELEAVGASIVSLHRLTGQMLELEQRYERGENLSIQRWDHPPTGGSWWPTRRGWPGTGATRPRAAPSSGHIASAAGTTTSRSSACLRS